jgi:hypothetical protein
MITCYLGYQIPMDKIAEFEAYGAMWLELLPRFGGIHHGYFLPSEGESDIALSLFSFPSFAAYEQYRKAAATDPDVAKATAFARQTKCFRRYERSFFRPVLPG